MFWFSTTTLHGCLVVMDVSEVHRNGVRCFTAAYSEDPRVCVTDLMPDVALRKLTAHLNKMLAAPPMYVTFSPEVHAVVAA